jgi:carbon starvation protein
MAYRFYGGYLERAFGVDKSQITPAHSMRDSVDYDPAPRLVLFGHHSVLLRVVVPLWDLL